MLSRTVSESFMYKRFLRVFDCDLSTHAIISGYLFGLIFALFTGRDLSAQAIPDMSSTFLQSGGVPAFMQVASEQMVYAFFIFFTGFIPYTAFISSAILFVRASLASYSSLILAFHGVSEALYILHTLSSVFIICVCFAISKCAYRHLHAEGRTASAKNTLSYTFEFLFFSGIMIILIFCRNIALAFV